MCHTGLCLRARPLRVQRTAHVGLERWSLSGARQRMQKMTTIATVACWVGTLAGSGASAASAASGSGSAGSTDLASQQLVGSHAVPLFRHHALGTPLPMRDAVLRGTNGSQDLSLIHI